MLSVATKQRASSVLMPESMVMTGMPALRAFCTVGTRALASQAAMTIALTFWVMKSSMIEICPATSVSSAGPFQRISQPDSLPAASAPAWTVFQKT